MKKFGKNEYFFWHIRKVSEGFKVYICLYDDTEVQVGDCTTYFACYNTIAIFYRFYRYLKRGGKL